MKRKEIWKDIAGYEGLYQVSSYGKIFSLRRNKIRKPHIVQGYCHITLCQNTIDKNYKIHRLVAKAFIPNPENKPFINHKKGNKRDNRVWMLEWCTCKENTIHAFAIGLRKATAGSFKKGTPNFKRRRKVLQYTMTETFIKEFSTIGEAAKSIKRSHSAIINCIKNKTKHSGGYIWKYKF